MQLIGYKCGNTFLCVRHAHEQFPELDVMAFTHDAAGNVVRAVYDTDKEYSINALTGARERWTPQCEACSTIDWLRCI